jgi:hypothetical protein
MTDIGNMTTEEALAHFGVKGMKWGVHKNSSGGSAPSSTEVYKARSNLQKQAAGIQAARRDVRAAKRPETKAKRKEILKGKKVDFLKNPDRATAQRITKGDLALTGIIVAAHGPFAGFAAGGAAVGAASRVATRKVIEKKQASGAYDKK